VYEEVNRKCLRLSVVSSVPCKVCMVWCLYGVVFEVWVQVSLKSAQDQCDDIIDTSNELDDSPETDASSDEARDTWHW